MRDSLFRAAQKCNYFPMEEVIAQEQNTKLAEDVFTGSFVELPVDIATVETGPNGGKLIIWPYPKGTADCIDRANCADDFLRSNQDYKVVTDLGFEHMTSLEKDPDDIIVFAAFEDVIHELRLDESGYLLFRGRRCQVMLNELSQGYLHRRGIIQLDNLTSDRQNAVQPPAGMRTRFVNDTTITLFKGAQMEHLSRMSSELEPMGVRPVSYRIARSQDELQEAVRTLLQTGQSAVVRPFSASQGTGVSFIDGQDRFRIDEVVTDTLQQMQSRMEAKYGSNVAYPLTVTPFVEATKLDRCVSDLRVFVVYDGTSGGLRSLPGMVRRAQVPLDSRSKLDTSCAATNLNSPKAPDAIPGARIFPLAHDDILRSICLGRDGLMRVCKAATIIWADAIRQAQRDGRGAFSYGSVDFVVSESDRKTAVPIEMNGSNVGSHPAVLPKRLDMFGKATTFVLERMGMKSES